jgi:hypothetical protein
MGTLSVLVFRLAELRVYGVAIGASCRIVSPVSLSHAGVSHLCSLATAPASPTSRRTYSPELSTERCLASRIVAAPASGRCISAAFRLHCSSSRRHSTAHPLNRCIEAATTGSARTRWTVRPASTRSGSGCHEAGFGPQRNPACILCVVQYRPCGRRRQLSQANRRARRYFCGRFDACFCKARTRGRGCGSGGDCHQACYPGRKPHCRRRLWGT